VTTRTRALAAAFTATLAWAVLHATAASAQQPPETPPTTGPPPTFNPTTLPDELELDPFEAAELNEVLSDTDLDNPCQPGDDPSPTATPASIMPDDCWGPFPSSHYDIGCDEGAWNHLTRRFYCTLTDLAFQGARASTVFTLWLVDWAYAFGLRDRLAEPMANIAHTYQTNIIGPLGLEHLAWTYAICWAAITGLRGRLTTAGGELALSIVLTGLAGLLLANPTGYLNGAFDTTTTLSGALLSTANGQPAPHNPGDARAVLAPLEAQIHKTFVEDPYDYLDWGGPLPNTCAAIRDRLLAVGPHGNSDGPRQAMTAAGCDDQADFNHDPNSQRLFGAILTFLAAVLMAVLVALIATTIVIAQAIVIVLFAIAPFAALGAILTGGGRELAWRWVAALIRAGLVVVGMSFVLSLLLLAIQAVLAGDDGGELIERFTLVNLIVITMFIARSRIITAGSQLTNQLGARLSSHRAGGEHSPAWLGAAAAGGVTGFALGSAVGLDPRSRTGRLTSFATRDYMADRRLRRHYRRSERRSQQPVARERTELTPNNEGDLIERRSVSIDGPALKPPSRWSVKDRLHVGQSARARQARTRVEGAARRRATDLPPYQPPSGTTWATGTDRPAGGRPGRPEPGVRPPPQDTGPWPTRPPDDPGPRDPGPIDPEST
jgi:hypothetical protein